MKKITMVLLALLVIGVSSISLAFAYNGNFNQQNGAHLRDGTHFEDVQKIMTTGSFADLQALRQTTGLNMMPWVENESDFVIAQQTHALDTPRVGKNGARGQGNGFGRHGGCPMFNDGDE